MNTRNTFFAILALGFAISFQSCLKDNCEREYTYVLVSPVYKSVDEIRNGDVVNESPKVLENPGKIYFYNNYIFINESREGVHVIDNSNPENPVKVAFISIPGNEDISIKNDILYANSYIDLLSIDISDVNNATLINREENVFPPIWEDLNTGQILVFWEEEEITEILDCETAGALNRNPRNIFWQFENVLINSTFAFDDTSIGGGSSNNNTGTGGSMARFSIIGDYLYVVDNSDMHIFDLSNGIDPNLANTVNVGWGIETIFPYQNNLFIGSNSGMFIFDNSNPELPTLLSAFQHARACDPVFVKDNYAYVTLRDGNACAGFVNQMDLVDITDLSNPVLEKTFPMEHPHGLSIKENSLFLCEGAHGLKVFDISDPINLDKNQLDEIGGLNSFDAISIPGQNNVLLVVGADGFYQYNFDNASDLQLISSIRVGE